MGGEPRRDSSEEQNAPAHEDLVRGLAHVRPRSEGDPSLGHPSLGDPSLGQQGRCAVWGVLNVTPDSFSDGGDFLDVDAALAHAARMIEEGADVGAEAVGDLAQQVTDRGSGGASDAAARTFGVDAGGMLVKVDLICGRRVGSGRDLPVAIVNLFRRRGSCACRGERER